MRRRHPKMMSNIRKSPGILAVNVSQLNRLEQDLDAVMNALWKSPSYSTSSEQLGGDAGQDRKAP